MTIRNICAVVGIALSVGTFVFMQSLVATNDHQSMAVAEKLIKELPVEENALSSRLALDYRPNGRVMQGPPMMVIPATSSGIKEDEIVITKALFAQRKLDVPKIGEELTLVGRNGAYRLKVAKILDWSRPSGRGAMYPNAFVSPEATKNISEEWRKFKMPSIEELSSSFMADANRNFDRSKALLLWAAILTALCLLTNTLFLSIEARRRNFAILRTLGLTRLGVVRSVAAESFLLSCSGLVLGIVCSIIAIAIYVAFSGELFPMGLAISKKSILIVSILTPLLAVLAALLSLKPALSVRPLESASVNMPRRRTVGMVVSVAFGFGAFVAVEVWGASLMKAFVPSPEWPDAIVSILPGGVSSFDIEKLSAIDGVEKIAELQPLQVNLLPLEELKVRGGAEARGMRKSYRNALLLASDWIPHFKFKNSDYKTISAKLLEGDNCIVTEMMARARGWKVGDNVELDCSRELKMSLKIVGIVDLNWHMVTSRGLLRGLNRMPVNTDGPIFVSFDTLSACDFRPQQIVPMTHLWLNYKKDFLDAHGVFESGRIVEKDIVKALNGANLITKDNEVRGNTVRLHSRDEIADGTLSHGAVLIGAMARIPFIFIAVISFGFVTLLVSSFESRRREFLVLRTIGATRFQLAKVLIGDALSVAWKGLVFGLLGGAIVGWLFTFSTRNMMANWGLPSYFALPIEESLVGLFLTLAFVIIVTIPTSLILLSKKQVNANKGND